MLEAGCLRNKCYQDSGDRHLRCKGSTGLRQCILRFHECVGLAPKSNALKKFAVPQVAVNPMMASALAHLEDLCCECCVVVGWWLKKKRKRYALKHDCVLIVVEGVERLLHQGLRIEVI